MDWTAAIDKNRDALKRVLATLVALAEMGLGGQLNFFRRKGSGGSDVPAEKSEPTRALTAESITFTLPRQLHRYVLRLLRPAEAAVRRLIIVAARGLVVPASRPRTPVVTPKTGGIGMPPQTLSARVPPLPLLDRLSPWRVGTRPIARGGVPRIRFPATASPSPSACRRPTTLSTRRGCPCACKHWPPPSTTCRARQDVLPAGGRRRCRRKVPLPLVGRG